MSKINSREAYNIASQWGSFMRDGDPGAVFYTFPAGNAQVKDEDHRQALIAYTDECLAHVSEVNRTCQEDGSEEQDRNDLQNLRTYFETVKTEEQRETERIWWTSGDGTIELSMTLSDAASVSQGGKDAQEDVEALRKADRILAAQLDKIKDEDLRDELEEYGTWSAEELADRDTNLMRLVWLAGNDLHEHWILQDEELSVDDTEYDPETGEPKK